MTGANSDQSAKLRQLMIEAQKGDKKAYTQLLTEISKIVKAFLSSRISSPEVAEDVSQEVLMSIHNARHTYDPNMAFSPWMFTIARHKMIDYFRKNGRLRSREILDDETTLMMAAAESHFDTVDKEELTNFVDRLPEKQRNVVKLLKLQEYSVKEVASNLNMTESAVKVTAHRAYKSLRVKLEGLYS